MSKIIRATAKNGLVRKLPAKVRILGKTAIISYLEGSKEVEVSNADPLTGKGEPSNTVVTIPMARPLAD